MADEVKPRWARMGQEIRRVRLQAGLTQGQLGKAISMSHGMISSIERGVRAIKPEHAEQIDRALSTGGVLAHLWESLNTKGSVPSWLRNVAEREREAIEIREYHPVLVPGLLQTEEYASVIARNCRPGDLEIDIGAIVQARMDRQKILEGQNPPFLLAVLDEMVVRRPVGGRAIMIRQLDHLLKMASEPNITIQIIPFSTEQHPGLSGAFRMLQGPEGTEVVYQENVLSTTPLDDREQVRFCARLYGELRGAALPVAESRALMEKLRGELQ